MLRARLLPLAILLVFCMTSRRDWVLPRSRRKVSFSKIIWLTLVVMCAKRSCCRIQLSRALFYLFCEKLKFGCLLQKSSKFSVLNRVSDGTNSGGQRRSCGSADVHYIWSNRRRHGGTQIIILDMISVNNQVSHRFRLGPKR